MLFFEEVIVHHYPTLPVFGYHDRTCGAKQQFVHGKVGGLGDIHEVEADGLPIGMDIEEYRCPKPHAIAFGAFGGEQIALGYLLATGIQHFERNEWRPVILIPYQEPARAFIKLAIRRSHDNRQREQVRTITRYRW